MNKKGIAITGGLLVGGAIAAILLAFGGLGFFKTLTFNLDSKTILIMAGVIVAILILKK